MIIQSFSDLFAYFNSCGASIDIDKSQAGIQVVIYDKKGERHSLGQRHSIKKIVLRVNEVFGLNLDPKLFVSRGLHFIVPEIEVKPVPKVETKEEVSEPPKTPRKRTQRKKKAEEVVEGEDSPTSE